MPLTRTRYVFVLSALIAAWPIIGQSAAQQPAGRQTTVEKLGDHIYRVGRIRVDTAKREIAVSGRVNDVSLLEFVASTDGGLKAYESALSLDTDGVTFNAALLLIGLDQAHARVPTQHFDPIPPAGDAVDIWVEWHAGGKLRRERVEQLLFDKRTMQPMPSGPWVYTGSTFIEETAYLADIDGVLIGFVHSPSPVIENPRAGAVNAYGHIIMNPQLDLAAKTPITVIVSAIGSGPTKR